MADDTNWQVAGPIRTRSERGGEVERIVLDRAKGNVLDIEMLGAIRKHVRALIPGRPPLKLVIFEGAGKHFSFGASVPEHLPETMGTLIPLFHQLFADLDELGVPSAAVVRGQCLGGALELVSFCGRIFCDPTAKLGVPETTLGVFPPVAMLTLPWRIGGARATEMVVTGGVIDAVRAYATGLVDECSDDPEATLQRWFEEFYAPKSAVAIRYAWQAARRPLAKAFREELPALERFYLEDLMKQKDPLEGLQAFVGKRPPTWRHE